MNPTSATPAPTFSPPLTRIAVRVTVGEPLLRFEAAAFKRILVAERRRLLNAVQEMERLIDACAAMERAGKVDDIGDVTEEHE